MAGVDDHRQVRQLFQHRYGGNIQRVPGIGLEGADPPFAEDHILIAARHDIFRAHEQFLIGTHETPFEQDGLFQFAQLLEQFKVLHVAGTNLDHIHLLKIFQLGEVHQLGDDGQTGGFLRLQQQFDPSPLHPLKTVRTRPGLERTAPQECGT